MTQNSALPLYSDTTHSVALWVKGAPQQGGTLFTENNSAGSTEFTLVANSGAADGTLEFVLVDDAGSMVKIEQTNTIALDNTWHHIVWTDNNGTATIYIDGVPDSANFSYTRSGTFTLDRTILGADHNGNFAFSGQIDEVRMYNRVLTAGEVSSLYGSGAVKFTTSSVNLAQGTTLANGLVGHWTFDGPDVTTTVADRSGQGNNGYFVNGATSSAKTIGRLGQALSFDGSDDRVSFPPPTLDTSNSGAVWVYVQENPLDAVLIGQDSSGTGQYLLYVDATDVYYSAGIGVFANVAHGGVPSGEWTHLAVSRNETSVTFYKNGVSLGSDTLSSDNNVNAIGSLGGYGGGTFGFQGRLDDVRVYNRVITAAEAKQLYNLGAATIRQ
jgi:hypothetical protein